MRTLDDMEATAQRQLDGMTVNKDLMAKDVLHLVKIVKAAKAYIAEKVPKPVEGLRPGTFSDLFGDIFK